MAKVTNTMVLEAASAMHLAVDEMDDELRLEMAIMTTPDQASALSYTSMATSVFADTHAHAHPSQSYSQSGSLSTGSLGTGHLGHSNSAIDFGTGTIAMNGFEVQLEKNSRGHLLIDFCKFIS